MIRVWVFSQVCLNIWDGLRERLIEHGVVIVLDWMGARNGLR